jgi:hypothetical protein
LLPDGSVIAEMLSDFAVMRDQARALALAAFRETVRIYPDQPAVSRLALRDDVLA